MKAFAALYGELDATTSTNVKVASMSEYFRSVPSADAAYGLWLLSGQRFKRIASAHRLRRWAEQAFDIEEWLFDECYAVVGDVAETVSLLGGGDGSLNDLSLAELIQHHLLTLRDLDELAQRDAVVGTWSRLSGTSLFLFNKMLTGGLRVGVSRTLAVRALAAACGQPIEHIAHALTGDWQPDAAFYDALSAGALDVESAMIAKPYPFCLAHPLEDTPERLGELDGWLAEWKWDGIRGQLIRRAGEVHLWSRGEEPIGDRFPEIVGAAAELPDGCVLDGEVLAWKDGDRPLPFARLQQRIGRKRLSKRVLADAPAVFVAYDLLELDGRDLRGYPLDERRERLQTLLGDRSVGDGALFASGLVSANDWDGLRELRSQSRARSVEGLMLKRRSSIYAAGRRKGDWWKWKVDPFSIDAVMIYAQAGHGRRATLHTDYTFALWRDDELVPIAKAYSGLTDAEIDELDRWIRANTRERFGPVRSVAPVHVFELHFEAVSRSTRHKSGVALRFPRIARWRRDKRAQDADGLSSLQAMISNE